MRVDLPAPFPPTRPMTSPALRSIVTSRTAWTPPKATLMPRISTSGGAATVVIPALLGRPAPAVERVQADREDQHDAGSDVLAWRVHADEAETVRQRLHHEGAEDGTRDRADAACERRAPDDRRRDDIQLVARADVECRPVETGRRDGRCERTQDAHDHIRL